MLHGNINIVTSDARVMQICIFIGHYIGRKCNRQPKLNLHRMPIKVIFCHECIPLNKQSLLRILLKSINYSPMKRDE
jgi:late competence protein required for DNA uptake (superfamily II DNA/RNA helicase)